jgi:hypothetical protein
MQPRNATVLMEDDPSVDTSTATNYTNERKVVVVEGASRITGAIQDKIEGSAGFLCIEQWF